MKQSNLEMRMLDLHKQMMQMKSELLKQFEQNRPKNYMTIKEASTYMNASVRQIYDWKKEKGLPFIKVDGKLLFLRRDLDTFLLQHRVDTTDVYIS